MIQICQIILKQLAEISKSKPSACLVQRFFIVFIVLAVPAVLFPLLTLPIEHAQKIKVKQNYLDTWSLKLSKRSERKDDGD